jgi:alkanesulfonate monooxygenase SsuD/methylene tetrahydromethanopterin reductase-like flavin-dependent oxidoreductase (luciferase family)
VTREDVVRFGIDSHIYPNVSYLMELAKRVEDAGFDSLFILDHLMQCERKLDYITSLNAFLVLQAWGLTTKKVILGTGVSDPHRIHPAVLGQIVATLDHFSNGRATVGFGGGEAMNLNPYGFAWDHPIPRMREAIKVMKMLWKSPGPHNYNGKFYKLKDAYRVLKPVQEPNPPIWVAANRSYSRKVCGQLGDGWFPIRLLPEQYTKFLNEIRDHSKKAGRPSDAVEPGIFMRSACLKDGDKARAVVPEAKPSALYSPEKLELIGFKVPKAFWDYDHHALVVTPETVMKRYKLAQQIPDEIILNFYPFGTPDDCIAHFEKFVKAGCRHFFIMLIGPEELHKKTIENYGKYVIPYFKEQYK